MKLFDNPNDDFSSVFLRKPVREEKGQVEKPLEEVCEECETPAASKTQVEKSPRRGRKPKNEDSLTEYRSAKYTESQIQKLKMIKEALSTTNDGEALRWALDAAYKANKRKIERIVEEKQRIESL